MPKTLRIPLLTILIVAHAATAQASLFGPSVEKLEPAQRQERLQNQPLLVVAGNGQESVAVRTKGAAIAGLLVGFLAGSAMASGGAPRPGQNAQAYMQQQQELAQVASEEVSRATNNAMNADAAKNLENRAFQSPAEAMRALLADQLSGQLQSTPIAVSKAGDNKEPRYVLSVDQNVWLLDFHLADSLYDLKYNFLTQIYDRQQDTYVLRQGCEGTLPDTHELETWQADNQVKLFKAMESVSYQCANQVLSALSMKLLEIPAAPQPEAAPPTASPAKGAALSPGAPGQDAATTRHASRQDGP